MDKEKIRERLESALRPVKKLPTLEEVLEQVSARGVLRGPVDWVFPAWMLYVEYATQRIIKTFPLSEEEKKQLLNFRDTMKQMLREAWTLAKNRLKNMYKAVAEGTYRLEGKRLYAPDGTWMYVGRCSESLVPHIPIHGVSALSRFPDLLKLPQEKLELLQLGWRASDEGNKRGRPFMGTTQPWQVFAWITVRYGELYIHIESINLTREGVSISVHFRTNSWKQRWNKDEAISLVADYLRRGEWTPILTMWLGDGAHKRKAVLRGEYRIFVSTNASKELGWPKGGRRCIIAASRKASFERLREAASAYGTLLDLLKAHKWIDVKLATDDDYKIAYKKTKRNIEKLKKLYYDARLDTITITRPKSDNPEITAAGMPLTLRIISGGSGSLRAERYDRDVEKVLAIAERLESAGLRPNIAKFSIYYMVYIGTTDLLKLAEKDVNTRETIASYLVEKMKNGTSKQKEAAKKILERHPFLTLVHKADSKGN